MSKLEFAAVAVFAHLPFVRTSSILFVYAYAHVSLDDDIMDVMDEKQRKKNE